MLSPSPRRSATSRCGPDTELAGEFRFVGPPWWRRGGLGNLRGGDEGRHGGRCSVFLSRLVSGDSQRRWNLLSLLPCGIEARRDRFNKFVCRITCSNARGMTRSLTPLDGRGGEERIRSYCSFSCLVREPTLQSGAPHVVVLITAAIHGQDDGQSLNLQNGGPCDPHAAGARRRSTSKWFRPRRCPDGRWQWIFVRVEAQASRIVSSHGSAGGVASSSPACGGGGWLGLDCFLSFSHRVLFAKLKALCSNSGLSVQQKPMGLYVICTCQL